MSSIFSSFPKISPLALQTGLVVGSIVYTTVTTTGIFAATAADQSMRFAGVGLATGAGMAAQVIVGGIYGVTAGTTAYTLTNHTIQTAATNASISARHQVETGFQYGGAATAAAAGVSAGLLVTVVCMGAQGACFASRCALDALSSHYQMEDPTAEFRDDGEFVIVDPLMKQHIKHN